MAFQSTEEMMELVPPNISRTSRSFPHQENISKSHSSNAKSFSGQKANNIPSIDFECSLFMDETSADLDNYLNTTLPECSKYFSGHDNSLVRQDFECRTMNNLSRNIKGKYQKNIRGSKKNNKFFKSKINVEDEFVNPNEIPVIDEAMRKIFKPLIDKPDTKGSPKGLLKTYSNKHKKDRDVQIVESFGLPDEPLVPLLVPCSIEQDLVNLDVDKESFNNTLLANPWAIHNQIDTTITVADDFRRRSFSLFEDIAPSVGDSLEDEVKEGFNFEETAEVETKMISQQKEVLGQELHDQHFREPKIFLEPLNLDDYQVFRANNLSPITNKKTLLFKRLRNYSRNIEASQVDLAADRSCLEVKSINKRQQSAQSKNTLCNVDDNVKLIENVDDLGGGNDTPIRKINSRRSARLQNIHPEKDYDKVSDLNSDLNGSAVKLRMKNSSNEASVDALKLKDQIKFSHIHSTKLHGSSQSISKGVVLRENPTENKELNTGTDKKILKKNQHLLNKTTNSFDSSVSSAKRITRQSAHDLVIEKLLNTSLDSLERQSDGHNEKNLKYTSKEQIKHNYGKNQEFKNTKVFGTITAESGRKQLKINEEKTEGRLYFSNSSEEKQVTSEDEIFALKKKGNVMKTSTSTPIVHTREARSRSSTRSLKCDRDRNNTLLSEEQSIPTESLKNDKINQTSRSDQLSPLKRTSLRRSRRGIDKNLDDKECEISVHQNNFNSAENSQKISSVGKIEENKSAVNEISEHFFQTSTDKDENKKKHKSCRENKNCSETKPRSGRISDRLRSKSVQRFSSSENLSGSELLVVEADSQDKTTENRQSLLEFAVSRKRGELKVGLMKLDQTVKTCDEISPKDKLKKLDVIKSPIRDTTRRKKVSKITEPSEMESGKGIFMNRFKTKILNHSKLANLNNIDKLVGTKRKSKSMDRITLQAQNGNQLKQNFKHRSSEQLTSTTTELPASTTNRKKKVEKLIESSKQESNKITFIPKYKQKMLEILKSPDSNKNQQQNDLNELGKLSSGPVFVSEENQKTPNRLKSSSTNKIRKKGNILRETSEDSTAFLSTSNETTKSHTHSRSPVSNINLHKQVDTLIEPSKEESIVKVTFSKDNQKISDCSDLSPINKMKDIHPAKNGDKLYVLSGKDSSEIKHSFEEQQRRLESTATNQIQEEKDDELCEPSEKKSNEIVSISQDNQTTLDSYKSPDITNIHLGKSDELNQVGSSQEVFDPEDKQPEETSSETVLNENQQKMHNCRMEIIANNNQQKKNDELRELLDEESTKILVDSSEVGSRTLTPDEILLQEIEHFDEILTEHFCGKVSFSNDNSITPDTSKSVFLATESSRKIVMNTVGKPETTDCSQQQLCTKLQPEINDNRGGLSSEDFVKNKLIALEDDHITRDKIDELLEELSADEIFTSKNKTDHSKQSNNLNDPPRVEDVEEMFTSQPNINPKTISNSFYENQQTEKSGISESQEREFDEEIFVISNPNSKTVIKEQIKSQQGTPCVDRMEKGLDCGQEVIRNDLDENGTRNESERHDEIKEHHRSEVLSEVQNTNEKNFKEGLDDTNTSYDEEKLHYRSEDEDNQTKTEKIKNLGVNPIEELTITSNSTTTVDFYGTEKKEVNDADFKNRDITGQEHLASVYLKNDEKSLKTQSELKNCDDSINKKDIIADTKFERKTENLKNLSAVNNRSTNVNYFLEEKKLVESDPLKKTGYLDEYLDVGYDIHRRTSFRKILERVMEMSRLEMEIHQKKASRLQRCKSVPHESFNSTKTYTTPKSSSVDNTSKYLRSDRDSITKKMDFSKAKKRLEYFTDSNILEPKHTKRCRTKSLHVTKSLGSESSRLQVNNMATNETHPTANVVEDEGKVQKDVLNKKKRKRRCISESDGLLDRTDSKNINSEVSSSEVITMGTELTDVRGDTNTKFKNSVEVDDGNSNVNRVVDAEAKKEGKRVEENHCLKLSSDRKMLPFNFLDDTDSEVQDAELDGPGRVRKRTRSFSECVSKQGDETDSSMRRCKSVIGRSKRMSKRDSRRLRRISKLDRSGDEESTITNLIGTRVNSKAAKKVLYEFKVGDSIWGKVGNYPYWPCIIVLDPETSEFKKYKLLRTTPYYHVRFFGDNGKRAWTPHVMPYEGPDDLDKLARQFWREGVQTSYIKECYCIKPTQCDKWKKAVSEAETMKNESVEYKINFFKEIFGEDNEDAETSETSTQYEAPTSKLKKKKKGKINQDDGNKSSQNKKVPMRESSVLSCINDVITTYCTSGDDDTLGQDTSPLVGKEITRRKRKRKKKVMEKVAPKGSNDDLGFDLLNLPPANTMNSSSTISKQNISLHSEDALDKLSREKTLTLHTKSVQKYSSTGRDKIINPKVLNMRKEKIVINRSMSDFNSSTISTTPHETIRMRSRSLSRLENRITRDDSVSKSEFCAPSAGSVSSSISNLIFNTPKLRDRKQVVPADQSDSESRASDNSFVNSNVYPLSQYKKNLFRGVAKDKVCQICEKLGDVVKCRGPCNGDYHVRCVENFLKNTEKQVSELRDNESKVYDRTNEQVQIITVSSRKKLPDNLTLSPRNGDTSLTEVQIDRKMKEIMNQIESNGSYNAEFMESTDSGGDEVIFDDKSKDEGSSSKTTSNNGSYRNSGRSQKSKGVFKHVTADDVSIISITEDGTVKRRSVPDETHEHKDTPPTDDSAYKCPYCTSSVVPPCFVCNSIVSKKRSTMRQRCSLQKCGRFFHLECLNIWPQTQWSFILHEKRKSEALDSFVCPRHVCHICASENLGSSIGRCPNDKLVKCLRCPATYHNSNHCVPAGSQILTSTQIVCPRHVQEKTRRPVTCNTIWCFVCSEGGNLICCETCPTSVHAECLPVNLMDDDTYICEDCESGRFPLYDEVVWVKCGAFRWWPAIILFPSEVPANVEAKPHSKGEFVVKFFGTYDYYWVGRGKTFLYQEGDTGYLNSNKNRIDEAFSRALKEAAEVYRMKKESKSKRDIEVNNGLKPPSYVRIKVNRPVGNARVFEGNLSNTTSCDCDPNDLNPCGPNSNCLNRILLTECNSEVCPAGRNCNNQSFEKRDYPQMVPYRTLGRGWGLKTLEFIQKGQFIIEYVGEIIDDEEYQRRIKRMHQQKDENYYFLTIDTNRMLDAGPKGNAARFMNHSCQPNCETQKWTVNGDTRVGLFAIEDISADTELTFNYNLECAGTEKKICRCGASNCSGYIGLKPDDQKPIRRIRAEKKKEVEIQEEVVNKGPCFVCGKDGDVGICTNKLCLKSYHLECVQLGSWPESKWTCPSHNCNICSRRTIRCCVQCTNSYCPVHSNGNVRHDSQLGFVCRQHDPTTRKRGRPRKNVINNKSERGSTSQKSVTPSKRKRNFNDKESERSSSRSERYRKRRSLQNEKKSFPKKIKLAN